MANIKPIRTDQDYAAALAEAERLWGAKAGTAEGDRLDVLATLTDAYEAEHGRTLPRAWRLGALPRDAGGGAGWARDGPGQR